MKNEQNTLNLVRNTIDLLNDTGSSLQFRDFSNCVADSVIKNTMFVSLTGIESGYHAARAAKPLFEDTNSGKQCGSFAETQRPLYLNRFSENQKGWRAPLKHRTLWIAVDYEGNASEASEALRRMNANGGSTIALTSDLASELACQAQYVVPLKKTVEACSEIEKYNVQTLTAMMFGLYLSMIKGRVSSVTAEAHRRSIMQYINAFSGDCMRSMSEKAQMIAEDWAKSNVEYADVVADGYEAPAAQFGTERLIDKGGMIAMLDDTEDWNHIPFWTKDPERVGTVLFANTSSPSFGRSIENASVYAAFERKLVIITDTTETDLFPENSVVFTLPKPAFRWALPVMEHLPISLIASYLSGFRA